MSSIKNKLAKKGRISECDSTIKILFPAEVVVVGSSSETSTAKKSSGTAKKSSGSSAKKSSGSVAKKSSGSVAKKSSGSAAKKSGGSAAKKSSGSDAKKSSGSAAKKSSGSAAKKSSGSDSKKSSGSGAKKSTKKSSGSGAKKSSGSAVKQSSGSDAKKSSGSDAKKSSGSGAKKSSGSASKKSSGSASKTTRGSASKTSSSSSAKKSSSSRSDTRADNKRRSSIISDASKDETKSKKRKVLLVDNTSEEDEEYRGSPTLRINDRQKHSARKLSQKSRDLIRIFFLMMFKKFPTLRGGFNEESDFPSIEEMLFDLSEAMLDYAQNIGDSDENWESVQEFLEYGIVMPYAENISPSDEGKRDSTIQIKGYILDLCTFNPTFLDSEDAERRYTKSTRSQWLKVTKSSLPEGGWGLFAMKTFNSGAIISVYVGPKCGEQTSGYSLKVSGGEIVDPLHDTENSILPLFFGAHYANDKDYHLGSERNSTPGRSRSNNDKFDGVQLVATQYIRPRQEIFVEYNLDSN